MKIFEFAVLKHPDPEQNEASRSEMIVDVTVVLAPDEKTAGMMAARAIPANHDLENCEIVIRPF